GISASDGTYTDRVQVSWASTPGTDDYELYRCTSTLLQDCNLIASPFTPSWADYTAAPGTTYYYRVKACNSYGCSNYSNHDAGSRGAGVIQPPSNVTATDGTYATGILVDWPDVSGAANYKVYRSTSQGGSKSLVWTNPVSIFADTNFVLDRVYWYWVKACTSTGQCSDYSIPDTGFAGESGVGGLNPPINPDPENGDTTVSINVGDLCWENGGGANSYNVYFGTDPTPDDGEFHDWSASTCEPIPQLDYSTTYYWRVDALADGETVEGLIWQFTTRDEGVGDLPERAINPTPIHYADDVPLNVTLQWENGGGATSYDVYHGRDFEPGPEEFLGNTTSTSWTL
ncbi:MAG: hypothetical protein R3330_19780, partial [Saprospiraceae bacterium]|nr:hypothetical protein [Saprospiraceae bacterium]